MRLLQGPDCTDPITAVVRRHRRHRPGRVVRDTRRLARPLYVAAIFSGCRGNFGPVTLFRVYPEGVDTFSVTEREQKDVSYRDQLRIHNDYNRRVYQLVQADALYGEGVVISLTDCYRETDYGEPMVALKSYILSPFAEEQYIEAVLDSLWKAREQIAREDAIVP